MSPTQLSPLESLKAGFRRACIRRLVGDEQGAVGVLRDEIPKLVVGWAKTSSLDASEKKAKLKELFDDESARADELSSAFDLFAGRFETRVTQLVREELSGVLSQFEDAVTEMNQTLAAIKSAPPPVKEPPPSLQSVSFEEQAILNGASAPLKKTSSKPPPKKQEKDGQLTLIDEEVARSPVEGVVPDTVETFKQDKIKIPTAGIGLRFDEIEEMIDEILSF
jgi:hypothetical protein